MESSNGVKYTVSLDDINVNTGLNALTEAANKFEEVLDRLQEKANRLKSTLAECGSLPVSPEPTELITSGPNIVYTIALGDIKTLAQAPADAFAPEFLQELENALPHIFNPRTKEPGKAKLELNLTNSGNYKTPKGEA